MYYMKIFKKGLILCLTISMCVFLYPAYNSYAFSWINIDLENSEPVEINALIMEVNTAKSYMIVAEKKINIISFKDGKKIYKTKLMNKKGRVVQLSSFKEGQRVLVKGVKLINEQIVALEIKKIDKKKYRVIQKALSIKPLE